MGCPLQNAIQMMRCLDETGTLEYGQLFVQYSKARNISSYLVEREVVVAKNTLGQHMGGPLHEARQMMGCLDETGNFEYGQVFVQYSKPENISIYLFEGEIVVAEFHVCIRVLFVF
ncbi:hypothetical protein RD792_008568 [Penstemon davidsonii]|uniref:RNA-dependent RNA polymerase n=1 Tax=Penstemon davidsonii TaxID=160366 RepID=A0ABR0D9I4_9LAMI|nr:hypothetical protein RD792_008568 [Penstemon davidsonii]